MSRLDLGLFKETLPVGRPDEVDPIGSFEVWPWFVRESVTFRASCGGAHTPNSKYARSELREKREWSNSGPRANDLVIEAAVLALPEAGQSAVVAQIHDQDDDVVMIRAVGVRGTANVSFYASESKGKGKGSKEHYLGTCRLGEHFRVQLAASNGEIRVYWRTLNMKKGPPNVRISRRVVDAYFKAGVYLQSNTEKDKSTAYGEAIFWEIQVNHA